MVVPPTALFVAADEPLLIFSSVGEAVQYLEAIDVDDEVYPAAYGPRGEPYSITAVGGLVIIEPSGEPDKPDDLKHLLLHYLRSTERATDAAATLAALVEKVWAIKPTQQA